MDSLGRVAQRGPQGRMTPAFGSFPRLATEPFSTTSPVDESYNCIAWAAGDSDRWWQPTPIGPYYWPDGLPLSDYSLSNYVAAYGRLGYEVCSSGELEDGIEKVALYEHNGMASHACRQLFAEPGRANLERTSTSSTSTPIR
jgi:hypothetical protein